MHDQREQTSEDQDASSQPAPSDPFERGRQQGFEQGLEQGREEGRQQGVIAGKIQLVEQLLGKEETQLELLLQCPMPDLSAMLLDLLQQLRERRS